jgi:hypothetical protein
MGGGERNACRECMPWWWWQIVGSSERARLDGTTIAFVYIYKLPAATESVNTFCAHNFVQVVQRRCLLWWCSQLIVAELTNKRMQHRQDLNLGVRRH